MKHRLNFFDLFAGCGGLSLGLENAGFDPLLFSELSQDARETYLHNRIDQHAYLSSAEFCVPDVEKLVRKQFAARVMDACDQNFGVSIQNGDLDLLVGGPPCQGYSTYGHRRSYAVEKRDLPTNHLFKRMIRAIEIFQPKVFLFENVQGLLGARWTKNGQKGEIWHDVLSAFHTKLDHSYVIRHDFLKAKEYGVPQNRPRVFIVGISRDLKYAKNDSLTESSLNAREAGLLPKSACTIRPPNLEQLLGDLIDPEYESGRIKKTTNYPTAPKNTVQRASRTLPDGSVLGRGAQLSEHDYSTHCERVRKRFQYMIDNDGDIPSHMRTKKACVRLLPRKWGKDGPNITATSLPDDYVHYSAPRILTVREWARLQTFPDWYEFKGPRTTGGMLRAGNPRSGNFTRVVPKYTQIGNAVPVELGRHIGEHLYNIVSEG